MLAHKPGNNPVIKLTHPSVNKLTSLAQPSALLLWYATMAWTRLWLTATLTLLAGGQTGGQTDPARGVLPFAPVAYTSPRLNQSYKASAEFDPKRMEHLYFVTNLFLDLIQRDDSAALGKYLHWGGDVCVCVCVSRALK